jgi:hypothetical protein
MAYFCEPINIEIFKRECDFDDAHINFSMWLEARVQKEKENISMKCMRFVFAQDKKIIQTQYHSVGRMPLVTYYREFFKP